MKSIQLFHRITSFFTHYHRNSLRFMSQTSISCGNKMNDQKSQEVTDDRQSDDIVKPDGKEVSSVEERNQMHLKTDSNAPKIREKLRKWVLLLSYCGQNYYGMQRQTQDEEFPTIEYRLFESLWKSGVISEEKLKEQQLCRFQRAARTDKGVSAIKQIVSMLLPIDFKDLIPKVNESLPPEIRIIDCLRVTKFFDAKNFCDGRTYSYLMPSFALCPIEEHTTESFRLSSETLNEFNELLKLYVGTHNFHNFTSAKAPTDASAMRYIISMDCSQPFVMNDLEFVVVRVKGQAFMLHQIRKMIGLAIAVIRSITNKETIIKAFEPLRIDIPRAPGLGLLLEEVHYDQYNKRYGGDGIHEPIKWDDKSEEVDAFKHKYIYPNIVETEKRDKPMFVWLQTLIFHTYSERKQGLKDVDNQSGDDSSDSSIFRAHKKAKIESSDKLENSLNEDMNNKQELASN